MKLIIPLFFVLVVSNSTYAILAGGEFALPSDSPSNRLDTEGIYGFVGALEIASGGLVFYRRAKRRESNSRL